TLSVPRRITLALSTVGWRSGRPYSITLGTDNNGDSSNNDRPDPATCSFLHLTSDECARNGATGPSSWSLPQARLTKIFILSEVKPSASPSLGRLVSSFAEPEPQRGNGGGGGGGGGGDDGGNNGFGGGNSSNNPNNNPNRVPTGARTLSFTIQASNF